MTADQAPNETLAGVRDTIAETLEAGARLRRMERGRRCTALAVAAAALVEASSSPARQPGDRLVESTGLSLEMVRWAIGSSLRDVTAAKLMDLTALSPPLPRALPVLPRMVALILAGNVFTASVRPIFRSLALGVPVVCKGSSRDDTFPRLLAERLADVEPDLGKALGVCSFPGGTLPLEEALFERADVVEIYGGDQTLGALRARIRPTVRLIEHGHGASAAYLGAAALSSEGEATAAAERLALDVAAYDQQGCLSPQVALVRRGAAIGVDDVLARMHHALASIEDRLPRGPISADVGAAQMQWRAMMATVGDLREGATHAVSSTDGSALRIGPGWRNLLILSCDGPEHAAAILAPWGVHLKAIGVGTEDDDAPRLAAALPPPLCPRLCRLGAMQTPDFEALADGSPALENMVRWVDIRA